MLKYVHKLLVASITVCIFHGALFPLEEAPQRARWCCAEGGFLAWKTEWLRRNSSTGCRMPPVRRFLWHRGVFHPQLQGAPRSSPALPPPGRASRGCNSGEAAAKEKPLCFQSWALVMPLSCPCALSSPETSHQHGGVRGLDHLWSESACPQGREKEGFRAQAAGSWENTV